MYAMTSSSPIDGATFRGQVLSKQPHPLKSLDSLAMVMSCHRGEEICGQYQRAEYWYCVISGAARRCAFRPDGRRQIIDLVLPGDFFGFSVREEYDSTVDAVVEGMLVASYPRRRVEMMADSDPRLAREILRLAFEAMSRLEAQLLVLGRITALEKVGSFILEMAARLSHGRGDSVALPVARYDIAYYLAV